MNQDAAPDLSVANLVAVLAKHGIDASVSGPPRTASRMCSLLAVEPHGLYYATREARLPESIVDSVIVCDAGNEPGDDRNTRIVTNNPQLAFYLLQRHFFGRSPRRGIHPTAIVADEASIDPSAYIGPYCVIGRARVGADCALESHVVLYDNVVLEDGVVVEPHTTLGATGVAWTWDPTGTEKIIQPQIGGVRIGEQTFLGSDVTVVRGSINEVTTLGRHCLVAHGTKIGHGCNIGDLVHFANNVTIAGSVTIGDESFLSAGCIVRPRISLPRGTLVGAGAVVVKNPEQENQTLTGVPARATGSSDRRMSGVPVRPMPKSREDGT